MTRRRFYSPVSSFASDGKSTTLAAEEARHLREVLRLKSGDQVYVFDGAGREFKCTVAEARRDFARLNVDAQVEPGRPESPLRLTLAVALLKGEKFDLVVQKITELGATRIIPVITKLADIRLRSESDTSKRVARWQRIALEAAKQSGRAFVPEVLAPLEFASLLNRDSDAPVLMFSERGGASLDAATKGLLPRPTSLTALIGSEGGWTDQEISQARDAGWQIITLGGRTLRAETAAIAITTLLQHVFGDLV